MPRSCCRKQSSSRWLCPTYSKEFDGHGRSGDCLVKADVAAVLPFSITVSFSNDYDDDDDDDDRTSYMIC